MSSTQQKFGSDPNRDKAAIVGGLIIGCWYIFRGAADTTKGQPGQGISTMYFIKCNALMIIFFIEKLQYVINIIIIIIIIITIIRSNFRRKNLAPHVYF